MRFAPGASVCLREVWQGRVWTARPALLVARSQFWTVAYTHAGALAKRPVDARGRELRIPGGEHRLVDEEWRDATVRITDCRTSHSILICRSSSGVVQWYVNIEQPLGESRVGFDYRDWFLDVVISPATGVAQLKDQDELSEAQQRGLVSSENVALAYQEAEFAVERVRCLVPLLERWAAWIEPEPASRLALPAEWECIVPELQSCD